MNSPASSAETRLPQDQPHVQVEARVQGGRSRAPEASPSQAVRGDAQAFRHPQDEAGEGQLHAEGGVVRELYGEQRRQGQAASPRRPRGAEQLERPRAGGRRLPRGRPLGLPHRVQNRQGQYVEDGGGHQAQGLRQGEAQAPGHQPLRHGPGVGGAQAVAHQDAQEGRQGLGLPAAEAVQGTRHAAAREGHGKPEEGGAQQGVQAEGDAGRPVPPQLHHHRGTHGGRGKAQEDAPQELPVPVEGGGEAQAGPLEHEPVPQAHREEHRGRAQLQGVRHRRGEEG
jgi:hypothetical protein